MEYVCAGRNGDGELPLLWYSVEKDTRLSESLLWKLQRRFFAERGINAWSEGTVPLYVTSNAFIGDAYANAIFAYLRDCHAAGIRRRIPIVELGAGCGRLAFHILKRLTALDRESAIRGQTGFQYVMTDLSERNVEYWRGHPSLRPFVEAGTLDFALFDSETGESITLLQSGETIAGEGSVPLAAIANYFFDSVPQDAFLIREGKIYESLIQLDTRTEPADISDPALIEQFNISFRQREVDPDSYYEEPEFNRILAGYRSRIGNSSIFFPVAAMRCLDGLRRLAPRNLLLLTADHGQLHEAELLGYPEPEITPHGSFSLQVNYHALQQYAMGGNGRVFQARHSHRTLAVCGMLWAGEGFEPRETAKACERMLDPFGPDDFFTLKQGIEACAGGLSGEQILAYIRMSRHDHKSLANCLPALAAKVPEFAAGFERELWEVVCLVWDNYYPIGEEYDLAYEAGRLLLQMKLRAEALEFFEHSVGLYGRTARTLAAMAECRWEMRQEAEAFALAGEALRAEPGNDEARALLVRLRDASSRGAVTL